MDDTQLAGAPGDATPSRPTVKWTYGRRRDLAPDTSIVDSTVPTSASSRASSNDPPTLEPSHEYPPTSDGLDASASSPASFGDADASNEDNDGNAELSSRYEFDWKKKLRELDEDDELVHKMVKDASGQRALDSEVAASPQPSSPTGDAQRAETRDIGGSSNTVRNNFDGRDDSPVASRSPSPVIRRRQPNRKSLMPTADSDSESSDALERSPLRAVLSRLPSSPVLPASPTAKAKGKQKAVAKESDAEYASDDDDSGHTKRRRRSEGKGKQKRVKPPTKKEREETQKATARMMAERDATLPRVQAQQYDLTHFLEKIQKHAVVAPKEVETVEIPASDPIQQFSSSPLSRIPTERSAMPSRARSVSLKPFARTPSPAAGASFEPNGLLGHTTVDGNKSGDSSEDEEMPDIGSLIHEEAKKRGEREKLRQLAELKRRALEQQKRLTIADDDDDGLEIVHEDMQAVARDEAQARRADAAHGVRRSIGRNAQLALAGVPRRKSGVAGLPTLATVAAPSFQRKKTHDGADGQLTADQLNRMLRQRAEEQKAAEIRQKEEQWKKAGGKLKTRLADAAPSDFNNAVAELVQKRLAEAQDGDEVHEEYADEDEEDPDYEPADENDQVASGEEANSDAENQQVLPSLTALVHGSDDDDENVAPVPRGRRGHPRRALVALDSDDDGEVQPSVPLGRVLVADSSFALPGPQHPPQSVLRRRASTSSLEYYTENGTDKENDASLMYDKGEDKENTVVASQSSVFSRAGSFFSQSQGRPFLRDDSLPMESTPHDGRRAPFQELPTGDDDENPFSFSSDLRSPARRLTFSPGPPMPPVQSDENAPVQANATSPAAIRPVSLKGGLADLFESQGSNKAPSPAVAPKVIQGGGLSDFFSQQSAFDGPAQIKGARTSQDLALTADVTLQPALDIGQTLRRKADDIFEKEQELIAEGALSPEKKRLYVNEHGFLTQTRPMRTPARSQLFSPSQLAKRTPMSVQDVFSPRPATRQPLSTIDAVMTNNDDDDDDFDAQPRTRLKRRKISPEKSVPSGSRSGSVSPSPSPHKLRDAFAIMRQASMHPKKAFALMGKKEKRSEFIEGEAEESDDDDRRGFGLRKRDDEEDDDDETQDQTLQELVDDQEMDETVLAEDAVLEKHREQLEQDDQENEKLHQDAIQGKLRLTRRNRGVGFEDDDSDDDDDDEAARARRRLQRQKRKIDGDTLVELANNPETAPFALAYQDHMVEDEDFVQEEHNDDTLVDLQSMDVDGNAEGEEGDEGDDDQEVISAENLRQQLRAAARKKEHVQSLNPHDVSWVDNDEYEEENTLLVKEWSGTSKKASIRKDGDWDPSMQPKTDVENERDRVRMEKWAKTETRVYGTGRGTASVSVTGGGKKRGGIASRGTGRTAAHGPKQTNKVAKTPSVLSTVSTSRRAKFQD